MFFFFFFKSTENPGLAWIRLVSQQARLILGRQVGLSPQIVAGDPAVCRKRNTEI